MVARFNKKEFFYYLYLTPYLLYLFVDANYLRIFFLNIIFWKKFYFFNLSFLKNCGIKNYLFKNKNLLDVGFCKQFINFNFYYYQQTKNIQHDNLFFLKKQYFYKNITKNIVFNFFEFRVVLFQFQLFLEVLYFLFQNNKNIYLFNNADLSMAINIIYYSLFGLKFLNNQQYFLLSRFEWLKYNTMRVKFIRFLKKNNIFLLIFFDYQFYNFSLNFFKDFSIPTFALVNLEMKQPPFDYYLLCDVKLLINHYLIILWIFRVYLYSSKMIKLKFFNAYYLNFRKYIDFIL